MAMSEAMVGAFGALAAWFFLETLGSVWKLGDTIDVNGATVATNLIMALIAVIGVVWYL